MTPCTVTPTVSLPPGSRFGSRFAQAVLRYFSRSVVTREAVDQAWIDSGLGRLSRSTLEDIGAPSRLVDEAERRDAWQLASALDATRLL